MKIPVYSFSMLVCVKVKKHYNDYDNFIMVSLMVDLLFSNSILFMAFYDVALVPLIVNYDEF